MLRVGLQKTSLVDYPGKVAATVFFPGCNLRCPWCHNRDLVIRNPRDLELLVPIEDVFAHLEKRREVLGAVVLSGGEPLLQERLPWIASTIKGLGLLLKVDTNGTRSGELQALIDNPDSRPDFIAMDLKLSPVRYGELGPPETAAELKKSVHCLKKSGIEHEFRSLVLPSGHLSERDLVDMASIVENSPWYFAPFRGGNCLDEGWNRHASTDEAEVETAIRFVQALGVDARRR